MIEDVSDVQDNFTLEGAFEICAQQVKDDARFIPLGERLLDRLFADMEKLATACGIFASMFVIATAHLAEHEVLRTRPVFWRRLAAAAHASLVVRTCGTAGINHEELLAWAFRAS